MTTNIGRIVASPVAHHNRSLTVQGVVRVTYTAPFPHFILEDETGSLMVKTDKDLPGVGAHIEMEGTFDAIPMELFTEGTRSHIVHQTACSIKSCDFAEMPIAA